jgi:hypothetical protein
MYSTIQPGYPVFAHHANPADDVGIGPFVGVVEGITRSRDIRYLHVRAALARAPELLLPMEAVRAAMGKQVHLALSVDDLLADARYQPPLVSRRAG